MGLIRKKGFPFGFDPEACGQCQGRCCRGKSGNIWINEQELKDICRFLGMNRIDFMRQFAGRVNNRISLKEQFVHNSYDCIFFDIRKNGCIIYEVRPNQCRRFPFWGDYKDRIDELAQECPGIDREVEQQGE